MPRQNSELAAAPAIARSHPSDFRLFGITSRSKTVPRALCLLIFVAGLCQLAVAAAPEDFPQLSVPGHEREMNTLRELYWLHYPGSGPKATLWDEWLTDPSLWPALNSNGSMAGMRRQWKETLSARILEPEGYAATHQHQSIAHQHGWPFPFWSQGRKGFGWHFSFKNTTGEGWRPHDLSSTNGWTFENAHDSGINADGWRIEVTNAAGTIIPPAWKFDTFESPFVQVRLMATGLGEFHPFVSWLKAGQTNWVAAQRMYFDRPGAEQMAYAMLPMYQHPLWTGEVAQARLSLGNATPGIVTLQAFFAQY